MGWLRWVTLLLLAGCSSILGLGDPAAAPPDAPAASCMVAGFDLCAHQQPNGPIHFGSDVTLNTTLDCNIVLFTPEGGSVCVIYASDLTVDASLLAVGVRPLVLAATGTITVTGSVDLASNEMKTAAGSNPTGCAQQTSQNSSGGGAGGSFHGKGGNGGNGTVGSTTAGGQAAEPVPLPTYLRGGCDGGASGLDGQSASGGGAVQLTAGVAIDIASTGRVLAGGRGGGGFGGVGGGSGGMIALAAPAIHIAGIVAANGGGGAEGPDMTGTGKAGESGQPSAVAAKGGNGGAAQGGNGGDGSAATTLAGVSGMNGGSMAGGGGGGGGAGFIVISAPQLDTTGGTISPPSS